MGTKISALTAYASTLATGDLVAIVDVSDTAHGAGGSSRKMTIANLIANSPNGGLAEKGAANIFTAAQTIKHPSSTTQVNIDAIADQARQISFLAAGVGRWIWQVVTAETGSDVGSDLNFLARNDAGAGIRTALAMKRSTGFIGLGGLPATSAMLDMQGTTGALLVPRMTSTQRDALTPTNGMIIYNSTTATMQGYIASAWANM